MLNSDIPIQKTIDDKLSRGSFAKDLAYAIISRDTPDGFVIGMYGEWGSGKTSVINMVVEQLESQGTAENEKPVIMRFNPWLCADQKQLVSQFFKQLSSAIKGECIEHSEYSRLKNICGYMNDYAEIFDLAGELPNVGSLIKFVGKWRVKQANEKNNNIQEIKDSIAKNLRECELKLIVTIDDIDRLSNEEIISVFQLVKSLADFPYTTYLLAFDREIVTKALGKVQECDGAKYLEKIVQAPFELPAADFEDISNVFFSKMNSIIGDIPEDKWDKYYWSDMFHYGIKNYLVTIRHAIRLTNTFSLKYAMVKDEVNLIDLIGLTCLQVFEPDVYSRLHFHKEMLCGSGIEYARQDEHSRKKMEASWSGIISGTPDHRVEWVKSILCGLFPNLGRIFNSGIYSRPQRNATWQEMRLTNSVARPESFSRYFSLNLERDAIPTSYLEWMISNADDNEFIEAVRKLNTDMKSTKILDYIHAVFTSGKIDQVDNDRAGTIFMCLCKVWHELDDNEDSSFFSTPFIWRFFLCVESLLKGYNEDDRNRVISAVFNNHDVALSTVATLLQRLEEEHNRFIEKDRNTDTPILPLQKILELESLFAERAINEIEGDTLIAGFSWRIIYLLENIDADRAKVTIEKMIISDYGLINLVNSSVGTGKISSREVLHYYKVDFESTSKYIDTNAAYKRIKAFSDTSAFVDLDLEAKQNIAAFLIHIERGEVVKNDFADRDKILTNEIDSRIKSIEASLCENAL